MALTNEVIKGILEQILAEEIIKFKQSKFGYIKFTTLSGKIGKVDINFDNTRAKWFIGKQSGIIMPADNINLRSN